MSENLNKALGRAPKINLLVLSVDGVMTDASSCFIGESEVTIRGGLQSSVLEQRAFKLDMAVANAHPLIKEHARSCIQIEEDDGNMRETCNFLMALEPVLTPAPDQYLH